MVTDTWKFHCLIFMLLNRFSKKHPYTYPASFVESLAGTETYSLEAEWINYCVSQKENTKRTYLSLNLQTN